MQHHNKSIFIMDALLDYTTSWLALVTFTELASIFGKGR
jgi:hypothetical protein